MEDEDDSERLVGGLEPCLKLADEGSTAHGRGLMQSREVVRRCDTAR